jgi:hypothetical protein
MTLLEIKNLIHDIRLCKGDPEAAHIKEDDLYEYFIRFVSQRNDGIGEMAKAILVTKNISFSRWYA